MAGTSRVLFCAMLLVSVGLPAVAAEPARTRVTGTATYIVHIALSPDAVFEVTLADVSRADAPAEVIARTRTPVPVQVPIAFALSCDPRRINSRHTYGVRATIRDGGRFIFSTERAHLVLTQGHPNQVTMLMVPVRASEDAESSGRDSQTPLGGLPATFTGLLPCRDCYGIRYQINLLPGGAYMQQTTYLRDGHDDSDYAVGSWSLSGDGRDLTLQTGRRRTRWTVGEGPALRQRPSGAGEPPASSARLLRASRVEPMAPRVRMQGMFRYMADAARFRDCESNLEWPVAMSDDYKELERVYASQRLPAGADLLVSVQGRIEPLPRMEGDGAEPTLVVEAFLNAMPAQKCEGHAASSGLENNRWRPVSIGEMTVTVSGQQREPWIELDPQTHRVTGSGGCNRISGTYQAGEGTLRFGPLMATKMACVAMETETAFLRALGRTRAYRLSGRTLELMDEKQLVLARLEERNLH